MNNTEYLYYLPQINELASSSSPYIETFVIFIFTLQDYVPFEAVYIGEI